MKAPGSTIVHYVDAGSHCVPALARAWHSNGKIDFTVFTTPGSITAKRGVEYHEYQSDEPMVEETWHYECENDAG